MQSNVPKLLYNHNISQQWVSVTQLENVTYRLKYICKLLFLREPVSLHMLQTVTSQCTSLET